MRKVIQVTSAAAFGERARARFVVVALCDDSSLWDGEWRDGTFAWQRLPDIPQDGGATRTPEGK